MHVLKFMSASLNVPHMLVMLGVTAYVRKSKLLLTSSNVSCIAHIHAHEVRMTPPWLLRLEPCTGAVVSTCVVMSKVSQGVLSMFNPFYRVNFDIAGSVSIRMQAANFLRSPCNPVSKRQRKPSVCCANTHA